MPILKGITEVIAMKPYDRNDNDTYDEVLSKHPSEDVHLHMFRNPNGSVVFGKIKGDFTVESSRRAANNVLRFAKATSIGLHLIKSFNLSTAMPMSLVKRYNLKDDRLFYTQKANVYFDSNIEKFVVLMDWRFMRDLTMADANLILQDAFHKKLMKPYKDKDGDIHLGLLYGSLDELREDNRGKREDGPYGFLRSQYIHYLLSLEGGKKVILVRYVQDPERPVHLNFDNLVKDDLVHIQISGLHMELTMAFQFGSRYYLTKDGVTFDQKNVMNLTKDRLQSAKSETRDLQRYIRIEDPGLLVLPYTDDQWKLLSGIQARLKMINQELCQFFDSFVMREESVDEAITPERALQVKQAFLRLTHD
jgi:hypothetical protein